MRGESSLCLCFSSDTDANDDVEGRELEGDGGCCDEEDEQRRVRKRESDERVFERPRGESWTVGAFGEDEVGLVMLALRAGFRGGGRRGRGMLISVYRGVS